MAGNIDVSDHTREWLSALEPALSRGLEEVGLADEGHAKAACPVDTGRLRDSITHARLDAHHEAIGTNVEYARYVELGTSRADAQPFLVPAASGHSPEYGAIMRAAPRGRERRTAARGNGRIRRGNVTHAQDAQGNGHQGRQGGPDHRRAPRQWTR